MRVVFLAPYPAGGLLPEPDVRPKYRGREHPATWVRTLAASLTQPACGVELHVVSYTRSVMRRHTVEAFGAIFHYLPRPDPMRWDFVHRHTIGRMILRRELARLSPDIVQGFGTESGNGYIATCMPYPSVLFIQGILAKLKSYKDHPGWKLARMEAIERDAVKRAGAVIAETGFAAEWAATLRDRSSIHVIPHAYDPAFLEVTPDFSEPVALCVGSLSPTKGTDTVLHAFARSPGDARLVLIGGGDTARYAALAAELGISDRVAFAGRMDQASIRRRMAAARFAVIGSRMDTSPNAVTEAHAAGLPVVGTRAGGIPDMIDDGEDGLLVPVDDPEALSVAMTRLFAEPETARRMGAHGREKVRTLNHPDRIADAHVAVYRNLLNPDGAAS